MRRAISSHTVPYVNLDFVVGEHLGPMGVELAYSFVKDVSVAGKGVLSDQVGEQPQVHVSVS